MKNRLLAAACLAVVATAVNAQELMIREMVGAKATTACTIQTIACNQTRNGTLDTQDCQTSSGLYADFYEFPGVTGQHVTIAMSSTSVDPLLVLLDPDGDVNNSPLDDDSGPGLDALIIFDINKTDTWTIATTTAFPFDTGSYSLVFTCGGVAGCTPNANAVCLTSNRFRVSATFNTVQGQTGPAVMAELTDQTGYLSFLNPANVEAMVKVVNGCAVNGRYWVFAAGLTNVNTVITVTDTQTGTTKTFTNPQNTPFQPIQDTNAFATCP